MQKRWCLDRLGEFGLVPDPRAPAQALTGQRDGDYFIRPPGRFNGPSPRD